MTRRRFGIGEADEGERARHVVELPGRQAEMKALAEWIKNSFINGELSAEQLEATTAENRSE